MRFFYLLRATRLEILTVGPTPKEQAIVTRHLQHLRRLVDEDTVIHFGRTTNNDQQTLDLVVLEAVELQAAVRILQFDPAIRDHVMQAELFPYHQMHPE